MKKKAIPVYTKQEFMCPKHDVACELVFVSCGGRFWECRACREEGRVFAIEGNEPHRAYGDVAEELNMQSKPQYHRICEFVLNESMKDKEYISFLSSISQEDMKDCNILRSSLEEHVYPLGGRYRKLTLSDVLHDAVLFRKTGRL